MTTKTYAATAASRHLRALIAKVRRAISALPLLLASAVPSLTHAQLSQTWLDANANNDWSLSAPNWSGNVVWTNGNNAIFGGTGEAVEIASNVTVNNITFNSSGYTIADTNADSIFALSTGSIITVTTAAHVATISESISAGDVNKAGAGILTLSGANTFDGAVSVSAGILRLGSNGALGSTTGATSVSGSGGTAGIVELQNGVTITGETINVASGGGDNFGGLRAGVSAMGTWAGGIILNTGGRLGALDSGVLDVTGVITNGTLNTLQISAFGSTAATLGIVRLSAANTYTGNTSIIRGRLQLGIDNALPATLLDVDASSANDDSIFDLNGHAQSLSGITRTNSGGGTGGSLITNSSTTAATLTLSGTTGSNSYSGNIQEGAGTINLVKNAANTQILGGTNSYTGATNVSAGTLTMSGSNTLGAITVSSTAASTTLSIGGAATTGLIGGNISVSGTSASIQGTLTLNGTNTLNGTVQVGNFGILNVASNSAIGTGGTTTVLSGGRITLQNGVTVSNKNVTINGNGGSNSAGAIQSETSATATWAGNISLGGDARLSGGASGTLNVNGVISGAFSVLYSRATDATTYLNARNTYTGDTQLYAAVAGSTTGARLVIGVDNALTVSRLSVISIAATHTMTLDLNSHIISLTGMDTSLNHLSGPFLFVQNNGATPTVLTLSSSLSEQVFNGHINDGTSGTGGLSLVKNGTVLQTLVNTNGYTGSTTLNAGTLQVGKASGTGYTGSLGSLASTSIVLNGIGGTGSITTSNTGALAVDNVGATNNGTNRLADNATVSFRGGVMAYRGSEQASTSSTETLGTLELYSRRSTLTMTYGGTNTATLTVGNLSRGANGGILLVNGVNLGINGTATSSVSRILFTTAPTLVGTTDALGTGVNSAAKNTKVVPGLLGDFSVAAPSTTNPLANTFLTYEATTGLRPLDPATEFTQNTITAGNNIRITTGTVTSGAGTTSINSLIMSGATTMLNVNSGTTLNIASGNVLIINSGATLGNSGDLTFDREATITLQEAGNTFIYSRITGANGVSYYGAGALVTNQQHTYSGNTGLFNGSVIPQAGSTLNVSNVLVSGPFGTGTAILGGANIRASTIANLTVHNAIELRADTTFLSSGGAANDKSLILAGSVSLTNGTRTLTQSSAANTFVTGAIGETQAGSGLTIAGSGFGTSTAVVLSGSNTYTGATTVTSSTLVINGSQSAATGAVNVNGGTLGGMGTLGGATSVATGATLSPGDVTTANVSINGTLSSASSLTLKSGSNTSLQITTATFTSTNGFGGNDPGTGGYNAYVIANGNTAGSAGTAHDKLIFTSITQETGAKITVSGVSFTPALGQIFNLIDWTDLSTFSTNLGTTRDGASDSGLDLDLPDISASGYAWDTSLFASHGIIVVTPEPTRALLLGVGLALLGLRRRKGNDE